MAVPVPVPVVPITDEMEIAVTRDQGALAGRPVALLGVKVVTVAGPRTFWAGSSVGEQIFVVLDSAAAAALGKEIRPRQTVAVAGVLKALPSDFGDVRSMWSLSAANEALLSRERIYLAATDIAVSAS